MIDQLLDEDAASVLGILGGIGLLIVFVFNQQIKFQSNLNIIGIIYLIGIIAMVLEWFFESKSLVLTLLGIVFGLIGCGIAIAAIYYIGIPILSFLGGIVTGGWQFLVGFIVLGILLAIGGAYQEELAEFFLELVLPMVLILVGGAALLWVGGWLVGVSYANWNTAKWVYLAGMVGFIGYTIWNLEFRNEVLGGICIVACFGGGLYALKSIFWQKTTMTLDTVSEKKVAKEVEKQEIKKIAEDSSKIAGDFIKSFPEQSLFRQKTITYKNPKTNSLETIELSPEVSLNRVKNSLGIPVDSVLASYSYLITTEPIRPSIQGTSTFETEVTDYPSGKYLLQESKFALELLDGVKYSINNFLKPHYLDKSQGIDVTVTGWADSDPIIGSLPYNGEYGNLNEIYYTDTLSSHSNGVQIQAGDDIKSNEVLAYLRSKGARKYLDEKTELGHFRGTRNNFHNAIAYQKAKGGQFRKVQIKLKIENKNLPSVPQNPPVVKEPQKECWVCKFLKLWIDGVIMTVCIWLFKRHHKKIETDKTKISYHKNWRNGSIIVALIAAIAYAFC